MEPTNKRGRRECTWGQYTCGTPRAGDAHTHAVVVVVAIGEKRAQSKCAEWAHGWLAPGETGTVDVRETGTWVAGARQNGRDVLSRTCAPQRWDAIRACPRGQSPYTVDTKKRRATHGTGSTHAHTSADIVTVDGGLRDQYQAESTTTPWAQTGTHAQWTKLRRHATKKTPKKAQSEETRNVAHGWKNVQ